MANKSTSKLGQQWMLTVVHTGHTRIECSPVEGLFTVPAGTITLFMLSQTTVCCKGERGARRVGEPVFGDHAMDVT